MRKLTSLTMATVLVLFMTGCGNSEAPTSPDAHSTSTPTTGKPITETTAPTETTANFREIILVENDSITVKITDVEENGLLGYGLKVYLENKTDLELMFSLDDVSVNGFMCDPFWAETVAPGKKSNTTISWFESDFEENGIEDVVEIIFTLRVYDSNDWMADDILNEAFTVNP